MQRDDKRVRLADWSSALSRDRWLALCAAISIGFFAVLYAYGAVSCRPGGRMWQTIARYEGQEMLNMTGTWLALPLAALKSSYGKLHSGTCGGTVGGRRPSPFLDLLVCVPVEDVRAEEVWVTWKNSFSSLFLLCSAFVLVSQAVRIDPDRAAEGEEQRQEGEVEGARPGRRFSVLERRWWFYGVSGAVFVVAGHGLLGGMIMYMIALINFALARATLQMRLSTAQGVVWLFALTTMELVFRLLGDREHKVESDSPINSVKYWSLLEELVCGEDELLRDDGSGTCILSQPFMIKGLCPWFLFRFTALKLISFSLDYAWSFRMVPSRVRSLEDKPDLVRRTETNLPVEKYGIQQYLCYVFYLPTYAAGPILSYNAFVSQVESEQRSYSRRELLLFGIRFWLFIVMLEAFNVVWWYSQKLHTTSCVPGGLYEECIFDDLSVWELFLATHVRLHFMWLQLLIIWRFGRLVALLDGVDTPENMLGCVSFNYTFEAFWRIWHSSMNRFMLRYLYNPLGGKARSWLAVPLVFTFVAYWHENTGFMTRPWWYAWGLLNAVGVTAEKALIDTVGRRLSRAADSGSLPAIVLRFLARGCGPMALIMVNLPALLFASTPHFVSSLFLRGWSSAILMVTLVVVYGLNAELVEALREGKDQGPRTGHGSLGLRGAPPLPPPSDAPRPSDVASAAEADAVRLRLSSRLSGSRQEERRHSFEAERQDAMMVELEDVSAAASMSSRAQEETGSELAEA